MDCTNTACPPLATLNLNEKLGYDAAAQLQLQVQIDNQGAARAWEALKLKSAQDANTITNLAQLGLLQITQTGATENQQVVSPVRTATGDAIVGSVGVSADTVAASQANLLTSMTPIITSAVATATAQTLAAVLPILVNAVGGASTTQPKPTA
jgi:hypothetical protein